MVAEPEFLPNLFILGAAKCGTTTLYAHLASMPDVCMSVPKEPFFFEAEFNRGLDFYRSTYFPHWNDESVVGDARHANLYLPCVAGRIHQTNPRARLMVVMRNPVERAFSHWVHLRNAGSEELSFSDAIADDWSRIQSGKRCETDDELQRHSQLLGPNDRGHTGKGLYRTYIDRGYYCEQIERYLTLFPRAQMKLILFQDLTQSPERIVREVIEFLELDPDRNRFANHRWENQANYPGWVRTAYEQLRLYRLAPQFSRRAVRRITRRLRKLKTDNATWNWLRDHYRQHNRRLESLLGCDLSAWDK